MRESGSVPVDLTTGRFAAKPTPQSTRKQENGL